MGDSRLRKLERAFAESESEEDELAWLGERMRAGEKLDWESYSRLHDLDVEGAAAYLRSCSDARRLSPDRLQLASVFEHAAARLLQPTQPTFSDVGWIYHRGLAFGGEPEGSNRRTFDTWLNEGYPSYFAELNTRIFLAIGIHFLPRVAEWTDCTLPREALRTLRSSLKPDPMAQDRETLAQQWPSFLGQIEEDAEAIRQRTGVEPSGLALSGITTLAAHHESPVGLMFTLSEARMDLEADELTKLLADALLPWLLGFHDPLLRSSLD